MRIDSAVRGRLGQAWREIRGPTGREFSWLSASGQASALLSQVSVILIVRLLDEDVAGQIFFALALAATVLMILDPRLEDAIQRFVPVVRRSSGDTASFFWSLVALDAVIGVSVITLTGVCWAVGLLPVGDLLNPSYVFWAMAAGAISGAVGTIDAGFATTGNLSLLAKVRLITAAWNAVLGIVGLLIFGPLGFLVGSTIGSVCSLLVTAFVGRRLISPRSYSFSRFWHQRPAGLLRFTVKSSLATTLTSGGDNGVITVVGIFGGPTVVVFVKLAMAPGRFLLAVFSPIAAQLFPRLSELAAQHDRKAIAELCSRTTKKVGLAVGFVTAIGVITMPVLFPLIYGPEYSAAVVAAMLFLVASAIRASTGWSKVLALALGRPGVRLWEVGVEWGVLLLLTAVVSSLFGDPGTVAAALAMLAVLVAIASSMFWTWFSRSGRIAAKSGSSFTSQG